MTNKIKKDCERKASELLEFVQEALFMLNEEQVAMLFGVIVQALISESLIVQKRVEELEKEVNEAFIKGRHVLS